MNIVTKFKAGNLAWFICKEQHRPRCGIIKYVSAIEETNLAGVSVSLYYKIGEHKYKGDELFEKPLLLSDDFLSQCMARKKDHLAFIKEAQKREAIWKKKDERPKTIEEVNN